MLQGRITEPGSLACRVSDMQTGGRGFDDYSGYAIFLTIFKFQLTRSYEAAKGKETSLLQILKQWISLCRLLSKSREVTLREFDLNHLLS